MKNGDYICRRCEAKQFATWEQREFGRVVCPYCGGTCDPTPQEQRALNTIRERAHIQDMHHATCSIGTSLNPG